MLVLVTGGAGYVGARVTAHLIDSGFSVTVFDKFVYGGEALLAHHRHPGLRVVGGDVRDEAALETAMTGVDAVVHLAGVVGEPACAVDPAQSWSINHDGSRAVFDVAARLRVPRLVFVSTCSNYGVAAANSLADEDSPLNPLSEYARAKVACEKIVLGMTPPPAATVLRFGTICGIGGRMRFDLLVSEMAKKAARGEPIDIFSPEAWRPFLHIHDAARAIAHVLAAPADKITKRVFNVVGENYQKRGLVELARRHFPNVDVTVTEKNPDLRDYRVDGKRIERELGFRTALTVEDAFRETAEAVASRLFRDPDWPGHSAIPIDRTALRP